MRRFLSWWTSLCRHIASVASMKNLQQTHAVSEYQKANDHQNEPKALTILLDFPGKCAAQMRDFESVIKNTLGEIEQTRLGIKKKILEAIDPRGKARVRQSEV